MKVKDEGRCRKKRNGKKKEKRTREDEMVNDGKVLDLEMHILLGGVKNM